MRSGDPAALHEPVMLTRCTQLLAPALQAGGRVHLDATCGLGGHAEAILRAAPQARVIGIDRDPEALELAAARLAPFGDRFTPVHAVYDEIDTVLAGLGLSEVHTVLFDLGVSSLQLDAADRGFAYRQDAPLDMRMDQRSGQPTAADLLSTCSAAELTRILRDYGEERYAAQIAARIVRQRARTPFTTSRALAELLAAAVPAASQRTGGHPAKRTFQALRIAVNGELDALARALPLALDACARTGGRVAVLSYHSLEDRMVKRALTSVSTSSAPPGLPVEPPGSEPLFRLLTRGAEEPAPQDIAANPRAASARLRAAERIRAGSRPGIEPDPARSRNSTRHMRNTKRNTKGRAR